MAPGLPAAIGLPLGQAGWRERMWPAREGVARCEMLGGGGMNQAERAEDAEQVNCVEGGSPSVRTYVPGMSGTGHPYELVRRRQRSVG